MPQASSPDPTSWSTAATPPSEAQDDRPRPTQHGQPPPTPARPPDAASRQPAAPVPPRTAAPARPIVRPRCASAPAAPRSARHTPRSPPPPPTAQRRRPPHTRPLRPKRRTDRNRSIQGRPRHRAALQKRKQRNRARPLVRTAHRSPPPQNIHKRPGSPGAFKAQPPQPDHPHPRSPRRAALSPATSPSPPPARRTATRPPRQHSARHNEPIAPKTAHNPASAHSHWQQRHGHAGCAQSSTAASLGPLAARKLGPPPRPGPPRPLYSRLELLGRAAV